MLRVVDDVCLDLQTSGLDNKEGTPNTHNLTLLQPSYRVWSLSYLYNLHLLQANIFSV